VKQSQTAPRSLPRAIPLVETVLDIFSEKEARESRSSSPPQSIVIDYGEVDIDLDYILPHESKEPKWTELIQSQERDEAVIKLIDTRMRRLRDMQDQLGRCIVER
jgi:hypothetical protein